MGNNWVSTFDKTWETVIKHVPYLFQDFNVFGFDSSQLETLLKKYVGKRETCRMFEVNCGKGEMSIQLAKAFDYKVKGFDLISDFVTMAKERADAIHVEHICEFSFGNSADELLKEDSYDLIIYDATTTQIGSPEESMLIVADSVHEDGYIVLRVMLDIRENPSYAIEGDWKEAISMANLRVVDQKYEDLSAFKQQEGKRLKFIEERINELTFIYPQHDDDLRTYLKRRKRQYDDLDKGLMGITMLIGKDNL